MHIAHYSPAAVKISSSKTKPFSSYKQKSEISHLLVGKCPSKNKGTRDASVGRSNDSFGVIFLTFCNLDGLIDCHTNLNIIN